MVRRKATEISTGDSVSHISEVLFIMEREDNGKYGKGCGGVTYRKNGRVVEDGRGRRSLCFLCRFLDFEILYIRSPKDNILEYII